MNCKNLKIIISLWLRDRRLNQTPSRDRLGFTLIELLVVIIIIGLLAAIALPSFLNQAQKARFAEAKTYIGTMSRLQQAYYLEKRTFTEDLGKLNAGINTSTSSFIYSVMPGDINGNPSPPATAQLEQIVTNVATPASSSSLKAFVGVVGIPGVVRIDTVFCIANSPNIVINPGSLNAGAQTMVCPSDFSIE